MQDSTLIENDKSLYWNGNQLLGNPIRINSASDRYGPRVERGQGNDEEDGC